MTRMWSLHLLFFIVSGSCGVSQAAIEVDQSESSSVQRLLIVEETLRRMVTLLNEQFGSLLFYQDPIISSLVNSSDLAPPNDFGDIQSELSRINETVAAVRTELEAQSQVLAEIQSHLADRPHSSVADTSNDVLTKKEYLRDTAVRFSNFKGAVKCSIAHFTDDVEFSRDYEISASLKNFNQSLLIEWKLPLRSCQTFMTAAWVWVYEVGGFSSDSALQIPRKCLSKKSDTFSISLPSGRESCQFALPPLLECKSYRVQVTPNYNSFAGMAMSTGVTVPPLVSGDSTQLHSMTTLARPTSLNWNWKIESVDCARLLTSVQLRIFDKTTEDDVPVSQLELNTRCFNNAAGNFSTALTASDSTESSCPVWPALKQCNTYCMEIETEFSSGLEGVPASTEFFTNEQGNTRCCHLLTAAKGSFSNPVYNYNQDRPSRCSWLIATEPDQNIWLSFKHFRSDGTIFVYDGAFSTDRVLLQYQGGSALLPVRSKSNKMLVEYEIPNRYYNYGFSAAYITVNGTGIPYTSGCGGYLVDQGTINSPANGISSECIWYIESNNSTVVLDSLSPNLDSKPFYAMQIYDGWNSDSRLVHSQSTKFKTTLYSPGNQIRLHLQRNSSNVNEAYSWRVTSGSNQCSALLIESSGTIKSPNYPNSYDNLLDCRWTIRVLPKAKVNLHVAYLDTQKSVDWLHVYDGNSVYAPLLLELSGELSTPVLVNSTTNEMLVRFVSNYQTTRPGFLALYSS